MSCIRKWGIMRNIFIVVLLSALAGCATTAGYKKIVSSWIGNTELNLIRSWGTPQHSYQTGETKFLVYNSSRNVHFPGIAPTYTTTIIGNTVYTNTTGGLSSQNLQYSCETTFEISNKKIVSWRFKGNDCKGKENNNKVKKGTKQFDKEMDEIAREWGEI